MQKKVNKKTKKKNKKRGKHPKRFLWECKECTHFFELAKPIVQNILRRGMLMTLSRPE